jgi:CRP/FNR family transcriptional regulator
MNTTLKSLSFFNKLDDKQFKLLDKISTIKKFNENYLLYYEQSQNNYIYFLISGLAKSYKIDKHDNEIFLYYIQNGELISEITTLKGNILDAYSNLVFLEDSTVLCINYKVFKDHFLDTNILHNEFFNEIIKRNKKLESLINREFIFDAVSKVSMMIDTDLQMFNKFKRHNIALILHIQPATLSRVLNKLKKDDIIDINYGVVSVLDEKQLKSIYKAGVSSYE